MIITCKTEEIGARIYELFTVAVLSKSKDKIIAAFPGGRSVKTFFEKLKTSDLPWEKIHIFMVDERRVPLDHTDSNYKLIYDSFAKELIDNGRLPEANLHPYKDNEGIEKYSEELKSLGGKFDIVVLGTGEDGHVAALYPNHNSIKDESEFFVTIDDSPKPPPKRMTASKNLLLESDTAIAIFAGEGKMQAFEKYKDPEINYYELPVKLINQLQSYYAITNLK